MATTINWPLELPHKFVSQSLRAGLKPNAIVFNPEGGPAKIRRRFTRDIYLFRGQLDLRTDGGVNQPQIFLDFYTKTLKSGSLTFNWINPRTPRTRPVTLADYDAEFLIVSDPSQMFSGGVLTEFGEIVTLNLEMYRG